ncbi:hypothetical protein CPB83DRAFT_789386 [Crepidotus variabilis]|uniref:BTB domain-containing protein n=1 Tax=Crepidotus variabilis TaxID=179855 RepID=A0A9P6EJ84_9AGAR|nr:hypothetical protein CPB83DRAFT_789386 [Crepidotus variabilis]
MPDCNPDLLSKPKPVHPQFNDPETDVIFQSTDGILFYLQRKYLEATTGAFPGAEFDTNGEITHLTESAAVLAILFGFVVPKKYPEIEDLEFALLSEVAEAAEKYEAFAAMEVCRLQLRRFLPKHAREILTHATKHDGTRLIKETIPHLGRQPLTTVSSMLPARYVVPWVLYRSTFEDIFSSALTAALELKVSSPTNSIRQIHYFTKSLGTEVCHSCLVLIIKSLEELRLLESIQELNEGLEKKKISPRSCMSTACQYPSATEKIYQDMKGKISELKFEI